MIYRDTDECYVVTTNRPYNQTFPSQVLTVSVQIKLKLSPNCEEDFLEIRDGKDETSVFGTDT